MKIHLLSCLLIPAMAVPLRAQDQEQDQPPPEAEEGGILEEITVTASRTFDRYLAARGTVTTIDSESMVEAGVQDLGSMVKYDPTVFIPFDMTTGDGAVGYAATGASSFNIRGIEGNRVGIEVDGIRQPPEYASTSFDMGEETGSGGMGRDYFDPSMFQLVDILKGGTTALYSSDSMGGAVSMKTLNPSDLYGEKAWGGLARLQFFSRNDGLAWQLGGAQRVGPVEYLLVYAGRESNETDNNGRTPPDPMTVESQAWLAKLGYTTGDHQFQLTFEHYERSMYADMQSALHPTIAMFQIFSKSIENWQDLERTRLSLKWIYEPLGTWVDKIETQAHWQDATISSRNISTNPDRELPLNVRPLFPAGTTLKGRNRWQEIDFNTEIFGISSYAHKAWETSWAKHHFLLGIDASVESASNRFERLDGSEAVRRHVGPPPYATIEFSPHPTSGDRISFDPADTTRIGLILQDDIHFGSRWEVMPGLRLEYYGITNAEDSAYLTRLRDFFAGQPIAADVIPNTDPVGNYDDLTLSPRFDATFKPTENSRIYAGYAFGTRNPTAEERSMIFEHPDENNSVTVPNPDLSKESSHAFKLGYKAADDRGRVGVELFYTRYKDFIEKDELGRVIIDQGDGPEIFDIYTTMNMGNAEIYGIEGSAEWEAGSWKPALDGFIVGLNAGYTIGNNLTKDQPINTVDPWKAVGYLGYADPDGVYGVRLIGTYTAAVTRTDDTTRITGQMFRPDAWFTLDLTAWWRPVEGVTLNAGINNLFNEQYYNWSTIRRGGGHMSLSDFGGATTSVSDRLTAPGRNFYVSATYKF